MRFQWVLFVLGFLLTSFHETLATECFVISGSRPDIDWNGALNHDLVKFHTEKNGMRCTVIDHWNRLKHVLTGPDQIPKKSSILIVQATHGGPGGSAACDTGIVSGDQILDFLNQYSKDYHIAFISDSCFSGDLMRKKLLEDAQNYKKEKYTSIENICLITGSYFGRMARGNIVSDLFKGDENDSIEKRVKQSEKFNGMISSAAWDQVGITNYFMSQNLDDGFSAILMIKNLLNEVSPSCELKRSEISLDLCLHPDVQDHNFEYLTTFLEKNDLRKEQTSEKIKDYLTSIDQKNQCFSFFSIFPKWNYSEFSQKKTIIESVFGTSFFPEDYCDGYPDCRTYFKSISSEQVLKGFIKASLELDVFSNPIDIKRRKACQNFKMSSSSEAKYFHRLDDENYISRDQIKEKVSVLEEAVSKGDIQQVNKSLEVHSLPVHSSINIAIEKGNLEVLKILMKDRYSLEKNFSLFKRHLIYSIKTGNESISDFMWNQFYKWTNNSKNKKLFLDTIKELTEKYFLNSENDTNVIKYLLHHYHKQYTKKELETFLLRTKSHQVMTILVEYGANIRAINNSKQTVLHTAEHSVLVKQILFLDKQIYKNDKDSILSMKDEYGNSALYYASVKKGEEFLKIIKILSESDNNLMNIQNDEGETPFSIALKASNWEAVNYFISKKANPFILGKDPNFFLEILDNLPCDFWFFERSGKTMKDDIKKHQTPAIVKTENKYYSVMNINGELDWKLMTVPEDDQSLKNMKEMGVCNSYLANEKKCEKIVSYNGHQFNEGENFKQIIRDYLSQSMWDY